MADTLVEEPRLMEAADVARRLGIKESTVKHWVKKKKIPFTKVGRLTRFVPDDIETWIRSRSTTPAAAE